MRRNRFDLIQEAVKGYYQNIRTPFIPIVISIVFLFILEYTGGPMVKNINDCFILASFLGLFITSISHFVKGNSTGGWFQILGFFIGGFATVCLVSFFSFYNPIDGYANFLSIPKGIEIYDPMEYEARDSVRRVSHPNEDLQLYNAGQPGIYNFDAWIRSKEKGTLFLKAFEVTSEDPLSSQRLRERSEVKVETISDSIKVFGAEKPFTIYEGDWGAPYAARFELWFKPENKKQEIKLLEKVFKIEGWQR